MEGLTQVQAAGLIGVTVRRVQQMDSDGVGPPRLPDGRYEPGALGDWIRQRERTALGVADDGKAYDLNAERARLAKAQADKTELEVAELRGEMIRCETVIETWGRMTASFRARVLAVPSKVAGALVEPAKRAEAEARVRQLVYEALNELAGEGLPDRHRAGRGEDARPAAPAAGPDDQPMGGPLPAVESRGKRRTRRVQHEPG